MAWENLSWWLRQRDALQRGAVPPFVRPAPTPQELSDALVDQVRELLARGGGVDVATLPEARAVVERAAADGGSVAVALIDALVAWPRGVERPGLRPGVRVLERLIDQVLQRATLDGHQLASVARGAARARMSPDQLGGLLDAADRFLDGRPAPAPVVEALSDLRHSLPLEARGVRHRLAQLMQRARPR